MRRNIPDTARQEPVAAPRGTRDRRRDPQALDPEPLYSPNRILLIILFNTLFVTLLVDTMGWLTKYGIVGPGGLLPGVNHWQGSLTVGVTTSFCLYIVASIRVAQSELHQ